MTIQCPINRNWGGKKKWFSHIFICLVYAFMYEYLSVLRCEFVFSCWLSILSRFVLFRLLLYELSMLVNDEWATMFYVGMLILWERNPFSVLSLSLSLFLSLSKPTNFTDIMCIIGKTKKKSEIWQCFLDRYE